MKIRPIFNSWVAKSGRQFQGLGSAADNSRCATFIFSLTRSSSLNLLPSIMLAFLLRQAASYNVTARCRDAARLLCRPAGLVTMSTHLFATAEPFESTECRGRHCSDCLDLQQAGARHRSRETINAYASPDKKASTAWPRQINNPPRSV